MPAQILTCSGKSKAVVGSFGVVTKVTLRTRELPAFFGGVYANDQATSDATFRRLIDQFISFYNDNLFIPHWGESITFRPDNTVAISMVFQGLNKQQAVNVWQPFFNWVARSAPDLAITAGARIRSIPARHWCDGEYIRKNVPDRAFTHQPAGSAGNPLCGG